MISLKLQVWHWYDGQFVGPYDRHVLPIGDRVVLADSRVTLFGPHDPVPIDTPFACRLNLDPNNPGFDYVTGDPAGLEYPCFSIGWRAGWWTHQRFSDTALYALAFDVEPGGLGVDYAAWDNDKRGQGINRVYYPMANTGVKCEPDFADPLRRTGWVYDYLDENPLRISYASSILIGATGPGVTPDPLPLPVEGPPLNDPATEAIPPLPTLADGPTGGMGEEWNWRDGRLNGLETAARRFDPFAPLTAGLIRGLK
jgi:hypothetical protein